MNTAFKNILSLVESKTGKLKHSEIRIVSYCVAFHKTIPEIVDAIFGYRRDNDRLRSIEKL